jgi:hypothetical protein
MKKLLVVNLKIEGKHFMQCDYIQLDPYAPNSGRRFVFSGIQSRNELVDYDSVIDIYVAFCNNRSYYDNLHFKLFVLDFYDLPNGDWCVRGHLEGLTISEYRQGVIDFFYNWQNEISFDWFNNSGNADLRDDYILACMKYSGLPKKLLNKDVFQLDLTLIKQEDDLYYLIGAELIGDRAYFGHDFHTWADCIIELYNHSSYFDGKKIVFINSIQPNNEELTKLVKKIETEFIRYKFTIG